ncbi:MAG TPA: hypothetical protein PLV93_02485 [Microthrixaceae bacterium]|nr:hypothetical protein [Microthrixaceae bacterium]HNI34235.1 hypothetical protein [Microthrixaceae bacterium]
MAAPEFVPSSPTARRSYQSPDRRPGSWLADRPGELEGRQPEGARLGSPGPDQGYVVHLTDTLKGKVQLGAHEHEADVLAVVGAVALKRAALFGRAPVIHDVQAAVAVLGFGRPAPTGEEGERRRLRLEEAHHPHFYDKLRDVVDEIGPEFLHRPLDAIVQTGTQITW